MRSQFCLLALQKSVFRFGLGFLLACLFMASVHAQGTVTGAIGGKVTDPNKAAVAGATVKVTSEATAKEYTATANESGVFSVPNLTPGEYTVSVQAGSFAPFKQRVIVEIGRETSLDVALSVQAVAGQVDVTAEAPVINTTQQDFSNNMDQKRINDLPINGQRWSNFALLAPGTVPDANFGLISFRGISGLLNNNTVDGADNNQAFFSEERGRTRLNYVVSQRAVQEFQVNTANYSAEYGRAAGGVVNAVTKSGGNAFHGDAFIYDRNNTIGARNPFGTRSIFDQTAGTTTVVPYKAPDRRYTFGGDLGGPIKKDKLCFFFNYDEIRRNFPGLAVFNSPSFLTTANTAQLTGKGLTTTQINSVLGFLNSETGVVPRQGNQRIFMPKVDWIVNSKNTVSVTYNNLRWQSPAGIQTGATVTRGLNAFGDDFVSDDSIITRITSIFTPNIVNEFRYNWSRDLEFEFSDAALPGEPTTAPGYPGVTTANTKSPDVFTTGGIEFGVATFLERPQFPDEHRHQFADTMTLTAGNHTWKLGFDYNHVIETANNLSNYAGSYSYSNINDFIIDYLHFTTPSVNVTCSTTTRLAGRCYTSNYSQGFGGLAYTFSTDSYNFFLQDQWRMSSRLTVNAGLRYEVQLLPDPILANPLVSGTGNIPLDKNNFGPRVGFAWDIAGKGRDSLRGGYGIYYGQVVNSTLYNALINTGMPGGQFQASVAPASGPVFPNVLTAGTAGKPAIQFFQPDYQLPLIHQMDMIYEHQFGQNTMVSASFIGSFGRFLPTFIDTNLNAPTSTLTYNIGVGPFSGKQLVVPFFGGARPNSNFLQMTEVESIVNSRYLGFVAQLQRRLSKGLMFDINYTRSSARDDGQSSTTFTASNSPYNAFNPAGEAGRSNFDIPNKLIIDAIWEPHFNVDGGAGWLVNGWELAPIIAAYSGAPLNATVSGSAPGTTPAGGVNGSGGAARFDLVGRNSFRLPKIVNFDLRLSRKFKIAEGKNLEFIAEGFNVFNRTQVTGENATIYSISTSTSACGATPTPCLIAPNAAFQSVNSAGGTLFRERQIQGALRFTF